MPQISINLVEYTTLFLSECSKKLDIRKEEFIDFKTIYYYYFYKLKNNEICTKTVLIDILQKSVDYYNNVLLHNAIDNQYINKILLSSFDKNSIKNNSTFIFCNRMMTLEEKSKSFHMENFPEIKKEILKSAISILNDFAKYSEKKTIPWELFSMVMYDAHKFYIANKNLIDNGTAVFQRYAIKSLITFKFEHYNRKTTDRILISPPCKNDILMQFHNINSSTEYSLPLLCHYFGHPAWYSQFSPFFANDTVVNNELYQFSIADK